MLNEGSVSIKIGKKTRENTPSNDSGIQMGSMLCPSKESINSKQSGIIDDVDDEEGTDSEKDVFIKKEEMYRDV